MALGAGVTSSVAVGKVNGLTGVVAGVVLGAGVEPVAFEGIVVPFTTCGAGVAEALVDGGGVGAELALSAGRGGGRRGSIRREVLRRGQVGQDEGGDEQPDEPLHAAGGRGGRGGGGRRRRRKTRRDWTRQRATATRRILCIDAKHRAAPHHICCTRCTHSSDHHSSQSPRAVVAPAGWRAVRRCERVNLPGRAASQRWHCWSEMG